MTKLFNISCFLLLLVFSGFSLADDAGNSVTGAFDIERCAEDLEGLQLAVRDATNQATLAIQKHEHRVHCYEEADSHTSDQGEDCDAIRADYQDSLLDLKSEFQTVENQIKVVQLVCGYDFKFTSALR